MAIKNLDTKPNNYVSIVDNLVFYLISIALFVTPAISFRGLNEVFEFPKMIFVYLMGSVVFSLFILKNIWLSNRIKLGLLKTGVTPFVFLFLVINLVSALFSISPYTSFFGYFSRFNGGVFSFLTYSLIFLTVLVNLTKDQKQKLKDVIIFSSVSVCIYAVMQHLGFEKGMWEEDSQARVFSTLGQPNWLAAYIVLIFFLILEKFVKTNDSKNKFIYGIVSALNFSAMWFTYSLSGFIGFFVGLLIYIFLEKQIILNNKKSFILVFLSFATIAILNLGVLKPKIVDSINDFKKSFTYQKVAYAHGTEEEHAKETNQTDQKNAFGDTTAIRLILWKGTFNLITSSAKVFLIGTGPETFPYAFHKFGPVELNNTSEWNFVFNKPHNYFLEITSNIGVFGLLVFGLILFKAIKKGVSKKEFAILSGLIALEVTNMFGWPTVTTNLILFVFLGMIFDYE